ncbi:MAG: signal peptidase I [Motiliproteus sp.]|jgi:signal peptidase I
MDIDFSLVLVIAVAVTGVIWLFDHLVLLPRRKPRLASAAAEAGAALDAQALSKLVPEPVLVEYSKSFFPVLALVLVLRSFLIEPFQIPSGSMLPTLKIGDFILVNKFQYGLRLPVIGTKVIALSDPQRGDVMVFKYPNDPRINYIKRVVGLPGDVIEYANKGLTINGEAVSLELMAELPDGGTMKRLLTEKLGAVEHQFYNNLTLPRPARQWTVPAEHYFMMGDNRDNSNDSRFWGFVPDELVVGKAFAIWMHWESWSGLPSFRYNGAIH